MDGSGTTQVREAVGVFHSTRDFDAAVDDLLTSGFDRAQISVLATTDAVTEKLGDRFNRIADLEDNPEVPRVAYVSREAVGDAQGAVIGGFVYVGALAGIGAVVSSGGALLPLIAAAAAGGAGGLTLGSLIARAVGDAYATYMNDQLDRGGLLVWVRAFDAEQENKAVGVLKRHSADDVHVHGLQETEAQSETHNGVDISWYDETMYWIGNVPFDTLEDARAFAKGVHGI